MNEATHATVAVFRIDMAREAEQHEALRRFIVPGVQQHPGFLSGSWMLDREAEQSVVVITYNSRNAAEALRKNVENNAANQAAAGLELINIRLLEVVASAP